jgi:homoserine kinase type II
MQRFQVLENVLADYPADCRMGGVEPLGGGGGFSGAELWRITAARGELCLRRFPPEHPNSARLTWIQAVVAHVAGKGFRLLPEAITTSAGERFCQRDGHLWELTPWLPGRADYWSDPRPGKLRAAMTELGRFHVAAESFSAPVSGKSPGIAYRLALAGWLLADGLCELSTAAIENRRAMPALAVYVDPLFASIASRLPALQNSLIKAGRLESPLQPCLRDIWHDHVLFEGDRVSGIVDVGSMKMESIAADVARLLGSLCGSDRESWALGQAAYHEVRPLSEAERTLVAAFDQSQLLLAGVKWVEWVFMQHRRFSDPSAVVKRMEHILSRLGVEYGVR